LWTFDVGAPKQQLWTRASPNVIPSGCTRVKSLSTGTERLVSCRLPDRFRHDQVRKMLEGAQSPLQARPGSRELTQPLNREMPIVELEGRRRPSGHPLDSKGVPSWSEPD
jgi:hypothetical protein